MSQTENNQTQTAQAAIEKSMDKKGGSAIDKKELEKSRAEKQLAIDQKQTVKK